MEIPIYDINIKMFFKNSLIIGKERDHQPFLG